MPFSIPNRNGVCIIDEQLYSGVQYQARYPAKRRRPPDPATSKKTRPIGNRRGCNVDAESSTNWNRLLRHKRGLCPMKRRDLDVIWFCSVHKSRFWWNCSSVSHNSLPPYLVTPESKMVSSTCGVTVASHQYCVWKLWLDGWSHHDDHEYITVINI